MLKWLFFIVLFSVLKGVDSSVSIQEYVERIFGSVDRKIELLEKNRSLITKLYRYFLEEYPPENPNRMIDLQSSEREEIFFSNVKYVLQHNVDPQSTFKLKVNQFSDWTDEERDQLRAKISNEPVNNNQPKDQRDLLSIPEQFDWTDQTRLPNAVTPVKNQRHCGSCYAFAMVGALEKTYAQLYNQSGALSPQQLIDCSDENGCEGGSFIGTFNYIQKNHFRLNLEKDYPSTNDGKQQNQCQKSDGVLLTFNSKYQLRYEQLPTENEEYMKKVLYFRGPIYFSFNCGKREGNDTILREVSNKFDHYASGVFDVPGCPTHRNMNHALVIVGYGNENGTDFWKVKNSWGSTWGDQGYIKIKRHQNMCGIASWPYYVGLF